MDKKDWYSKRNIKVNIGKELKNFFIKERITENFLKNFHDKKIGTSFREVYIPSYEGNPYKFFNDIIFKKTNGSLPKFDISNFFLYSFHWSGTKEGYGYWELIHHSWQNICKRKKFYEK